MDYQSLVNIFYQDTRNYNNIYLKRFHHTDTIHFGLNINNSPAFVFLTSELWQLIIKIQKVNQSVERLKLSKDLPSVALDQFTLRCLVDEIILTNDIEGVNSTRREIHEVLDKINDTDGKIRKRFMGLVHKYLRLQSEDIIPLNSCKDIRTLYDELVLPEVLEENASDAPDGKFFRKESVSIMSASQKELHRGLLPEKNIIQAMEESLKILNDDSINLLIRISVFHYLIGYIHPFYNGNGRLSRFISSYLLSKELDSLVGYRLSYTIKENISIYYKCFKICNDSRNRGDLTPFVITFLEIILRAVTQLEAALNKRCVDLKEYSILLERIPTLSEKKYKELAYLLLHAALFSGEGITTKELLKRTGVSSATLRNRLDYIDGLHYLISNKEGREKIYKLNLEAIKKEEGE